MTEKERMSEKPEEIKLFIKWFTHMFNDSKELVQEVQGIDEVKSILRTSLKKYGKKLNREGYIEGKLETAKALLKKKMPVKEISDVTGLSIEEIKKLSSS